MTNEITTPSFGVGTQSPREVYNRDRWIETPINMGCVAKGVAARDMAMQHGHSGAHGDAIRD